MWQKGHTGLCGLDASERQATGAMGDGCGICRSHSETRAYFLRRKLPHSVSRSRPPCLRLTLGWHKHKYDVKGRNDWMDRACVCMCIVLSRFSHYSKFYSVQIRACIHNLHTIIIFHFYSFGMESLTLWKWWRDGCRSMAVAWCMYLNTDRWYVVMHGIHASWSALLSPFLQKNTHTHTSMGVCGRWWRRYDM